MIGCEINTTMTAENLQQCQHLNLLSLPLKALHLRSSSSKYFRPRARSLREEYQANSEDYCKTSDAQEKITRSRHLRENSDGDHRYQTSNNGGKS